MQLALPLKHAVCMPLTYVMGDSAGKPGSSPIILGWSARLRIARGVARGLAYLHDKKCVHGNVKPSNILLDADMEPLLADLGVDRLVRGPEGGLNPSASTLAGRFGS